MNHQTKIIFLDLEVESEKSVENVPQNPDYPTPPVLNQTTSNITNSPGKPPLSPHIEERKHQSQEEK